MKAAVTAVITNDEDSMEKIPVGSQPIAFSYSQFRFMPDGKVGEQVVDYYVTSFLLIRKCFINNIFLWFAAQVQSGFWGQMESGCRLVGQQYLNIFDAVAHDVKDGRRDRLWRRRCSW